MAVCDTSGGKGRPALVLRLLWSAGAVDAARAT